MKLTGRPTISRRQYRGITHGYRSGLEDKAASQIEEAGLPVHYETDRIKFIWPEREATYTPDFKLPKANGGFFYVETKGMFTVTDRHKHMLIREQCPDLDIRFVFSNAQAKLYRASPTTYAMWCQKFGFQFASKTIPKEWLEEGE